MNNCCVSFRDNFFPSGSVQAPSFAGCDRIDSPLGWNSDDERDFEDQQYSPQSPMAYYPGSHNPRARFMADLPGFNDVDMHSLPVDDALRGLPVPDPCPPPPGLSLQDARKVHHIFNIKIAYDIVCDNSSDIAYEVLKL